MALSLFKKSVPDEPVYAVYSALVAQSRQSRFYAEWGVPDTVTGRFDMISLHLVLLFRRLRAEPGRAKHFAQAVFDLFFKDMDRSLREMGAGDLAVPKKIRKMSGIFYGLLASLDSALLQKDLAAIETVLLRNVYPSAGAAAARNLASYLLAESERLEAQPAAAIIAGHVDMGQAA